MGNQFSGKHVKGITGTHGKGITIWDECRELCNGRKEIDNAVEALRTERQSLAKADKDKRISLTYEIIEIMNLGTAKLELSNALTNKSHKGHLSSEGEIRELIGEIKDLETMIRHRQTAIRALETTIRNLETDQQSTEQADSSLDTEISQKTSSLLLINKKLLMLTINQATAKTQLLVAFITLNNGIFSIWRPIFLSQSYRY